MFSFEFILAAVLIVGVVLYLHKGPRTKVEDRPDFIPPPIARPDTPAFSVFPLPYKILFTDIDGVFHPGQTGTLSQLPLLEAWLRVNTHVGVVITSTWREGADFLKLTELFSEDVRPQLVGMTSVLPQQTRQDEIENFVAEYRVKDFIVLDDQMAHFPRRVFYVIQTDSNVGLTAKHIDMLDTWLGQEKTAYS